MEHIWHVPITELTEIGPVVEVVLSPLPAVIPHLDKAPREHPRVRLLIDTGAKLSFVDDSVTERMGIQPDGTVNVEGIERQTAERLLYRVNLQLPLPGHKAIVLPTAIVAVPGRFPASYPFRGLLGRSFLKTVYFEYRGPDSAFKLSVKES